jgi:putative salt-induced outer membrane protein YdiY
MLAYGIQTATTQEIIFLPNGDKISGSIEKFKEGHILMKSRMGDVKVPWESVQGIQSTRILYFRLSSGQIVSGQPTGVQGDQLVLMALGQQQTFVPREHVVMIAITEAAAMPSEKEEEQKPFSGYIDTSCSGNEGNKNDRNFLGTVHGEYKMDANLFIAHLDLEYGQSRREVVKDRQYGYVKDRYDVIDRMAVFAQFSGEGDHVAGMDVRLRGEAGVTVHFLKEGDFQLFEGDKVILDWDLGGHYTYTNYDKRENTASPGIMTRVLYRHIFYNKWTLEVMGEYYQSFQKPGEDRGNLDDYTLKGKVSIAIPVVDFLSFTASIWDEYNNVVDTGKKRNDFYWSLGLRVTF